MAGLRVDEASVPAPEERPSSVALVAVLRLVIEEVSARAEVRRAVSGLPGSGVGAGAVSHACPSF